MTFEGANGRGIGIGMKVLVIRSPCRPPNPKVEKSGRGVTMSAGCTVDEKAHELRCENDYNSEGDTTVKTCKTSIVRAPAALRGLAGGGRSRRPPARL